MVVVIKDYVGPLILGSTKQEDTNVNLDIKICNPTEKEAVRNVLNNNMILDSKKEVIEIIEIEAEQTEGKTEVELDLKYVANQGDEVTLLNVNKQTEQCSNIGTFTLNETKKVTCEVNASEPIVIIPGKLENNTATNTTTVYAEIGSEFTVTIPKKIVLDGESKTGTYTVSVEGDIAGNEYVSVKPDETVVLSSNNLADVTASISQDKTEWYYSEMLENGVIGNGAIDANGITAGVWNGTFNFNIKLENNNKYSNSIEDVEYINIQYKSGEDK